MRIAIANKKKKSDKNRANYPYTYKTAIEGMVCAGCVRNVENALNSADGLWARVDLENKEATVSKVIAIDYSEVSVSIATDYKKAGGTFLIVCESDGTDETGLKYEKIIDGMKCHTIEEIESALNAAGFTEIKADHHVLKPWIAVTAKKS